MTATLDPAEQAFLHDHQIDATPVLPGVMGIEAFAEAAGLLFPDRSVTAVEDVSFLAPFKFYRHEPRQITITCQLALDGDDVVAHCVLLGSRTLPNQAEPEVKAHFTGTVRLGSALPDLGDAEVPAEPDGPVVEAGDIYRIYFHGPAYQVLDRAWTADGAVIGRLAEELPPDHRPEDRALATRPRLLELAFQTAGVGEIGTTGTMALPMTVGRVAFASGGGRPPVSAVVHRGDGAATATVVDADGAALGPPRGLPYHRPAGWHGRRARRAAAARRRARRLIRMDVSRIAVLQRGVAAARTVQAIRELAFERSLALTSIALYPDDDRQALHVREADERHALGPATSSSATVAWSVPTSTPTAWPRPWRGWRPMPP